MEIGTSFDEIIDLALISFKDYKLDQLYSISIPDFKTLMAGDVVKSIPNFLYECKQNLEDVDLINNVFASVLTLSEKVILSDLTVIQWMTTKILDVTQLNNFLSDADFKMYSNANNLKEKINVQNILIERVNQNITKYSLKNTDWTSWNSGNYV